MATLLNKDLIRESTDKFEDREIMVTLTKDQTIQMKLKGMKSGHVSINILELYKQLKGVDVVKEDEPISIKTESKAPSAGSEKAILKSLFNDIRSHNAISDTNPELICQLEAVLLSVKEARKI